MKFISLKWELKKAIQGTLNIGIFPGKRCSAMDRENFKKNIDIRTGCRFGVAFVGKSKNDCVKNL